MEMSEVQFAQRVCCPQAGRDGATEKILSKVSDVRAQERINDGDAVFQ